MRIKQHLLPCFLPVLAVLWFVFLSPAFADFRKINECELARLNASLTGLPAEPRNYPEDELECIAPDVYAAIPAEWEPSANGGGFSSVHDDYGYDWLHNPKAVGGLYYESAAASSLGTVESGRYGDTTYATIGLGSQEVGLDSRDINVILGSKAASTNSTGCCVNCLCSIHLDGLYVKVNGTSHVTMYKSDSQMGIGVNVNATIDRISLATLSLGDCDGYKGTNSFGADFTKAGYVGLKDTNIVGVTASGPMGISVGTVDGGVKSVHMGLGNGIDNLNVGMSSLDTTLVLGDKKDFSGTVGVLGTIYMNNLQMQANGYLDIYNPAANNQATTLGFGLKIPSLSLATLAWGDADGFSDKSGAYVGVRNLAINNLAIVGQATFYTQTVQLGDTGINLPVGTTFVNIDLSNLNVSMAYMTREGVLGNSKDNLNQGNQVLRSVSWSNVNLDINTGTIQIAPH